jgi:hypothetical protein
VTNNNGLWSGWLDLLTPSFTISLNHHQFTMTHNKCLPKTRSILTGLRLSSLLDCLLLRLGSELLYGCLLIYEWLGCWLSFLLRLLRTMTDLQMNEFSSQSQSHTATDGRSVSQSVLVPSPIWDSWPDIYYCLIITFLFLWSALSDERTGLSLICSGKSFVIT